MTQLSPTLLLSRPRVVPSSELRRDGHSSTLSPYPHSHHSREHPCSRLVTLLRCASALAPGAPASAAPDITEVGQVAITAIVRLAPAALASAEVGQVAITAIVRISSHELTSAKPPRAGL